MADSEAGAREQQATFAHAIAQQLRACRKQQGLTQAAVARRSHGAVSKAALANYETGHRSLRVEVFFTIATALGADPAVLLSAAQQAVGSEAPGDEAPVSVNVSAIQHSTNPLLAPVRRWFALREQYGSYGPRQTISLDGGALTALAALMGITPTECRRVLSSIADSPGDTGLDQQAS